VAWPRIKNEPNQIRVLCSSLNIARRIRLDRRYRPKILPPRTFKPFVSKLRPAVFVGFANMRFSDLGNINSSRIYEGIGIYAGCELEMSRIQNECSIDKACRNREGCLLECHRAARILVLAKARWSGVSGLAEYACNIRCMWGYASTWHAYVVIC
jgi:hypothetical protein